MSLQAYQQMQESLAEATQDFIRQGLYLDLSLRHGEDGRPIEVIADSSPFQTCLFSTELMEALGMQDIKDADKFAQSAFYEIHNSTMANAQRKAIVSLYPLYIRNQFPNAEPHLKQMTLEAGHRLHALVITKLLSVKQKFNQLVEEDNKLYPKAFTLLVKPAIDQLPQSISCKDERETRLAFYDMARKAGIAEENIHFPACSAHGFAIEAVPQGGRSLVVSQEPYQQSLFPTGEEEADMAMAEKGLLHRTPHEVAKDIQLYAASRKARLDPHYGKKLVKEAMKEHGFQRKGVRA